MLHVIDHAAVRLAERAHALPAQFAELVVADRQDDGVVCALLRCRDRAQAVLVLRLSGITSLTGLAAAIDII